jgi:hypothetical protein
MNAPLVALALVSLTLLSYPERKFWGSPSTGRGCLRSAAGVGHALELTHAGEANLWGAVLSLSVLRLFLQSRSSARPHRRMAPATGLTRGASHPAQQPRDVHHPPDHPFFIVEVQGRGSAATGTLLASMSVLMAVVSPLSGRISDGRGRRQPAIAGSLIMLASVVAGPGGDGAGRLVRVPGGLPDALGLGLGSARRPTAAVVGAAGAGGAAAGTNSMMRYGAYRRRCPGAACTTPVLPNRSVPAHLRAPDGRGGARLSVHLFIHRFPPEAAGRESSVPARRDRRDGAAKALPKVSPYAMHTQVRPPRQVCGTLCFRSAQPCHALRRR